MAIPTYSHMYRDRQSRCFRLRECCRQAGAEVISNSSSKIHQTWSIVFSRPLYIPANLRLRGVLNPHAHVVELPIEIVLSQVDAPELGRVQDVRHTDAPQVLLLPQGGPVAQHDSGEDLVAVDALSDSLVLREGRRKSWQRSDLEDVKMREQVS